MSDDVTFNEPNYEQGNRPRPEKQSFLTRTMISLGLAHDEPSAQRPLAIIAGAIALIAIAVYFIFGR